MSLTNPLGLTAHHITASVLDLDRAIAWYQDMLGFRLIERGSHHAGAMRFAELAIDNFGVALVHLASASAATVTAPPGPRAASWLHIVFAVADPDHTCRLLQQRGARVTRCSRESSGIVSTFILHDSEGNEIEIVKAAAPHNDAR